MGRCTARCGDRSGHGSPPPRANASRTTVSGSALRGRPTDSRRPALRAWHGRRVHPRAGCGADASPSTPRRAGPASDRNQIRARSDGLRHPALTASRTPPGRHRRDVHRHVRALRRAPLRPPEPRSLLRVPRRAPTADLSGRSRHQRAAHPRRTAVPAAPRPSSPSPALPSPPSAFPLPPAWPLAPAVAPPNCTVKNSPTWPGLRRLRRATRTASSLRPSRNCSPPTTRLPRLVGARPPRTATGPRPRRPRRPAHHRICGNSSVPDPSWKPDGSGT